MSKGWTVHTGEWSAAVSAPTRGKARFVADRHYGEHQWLEDVLRWRVLRCPALDGKPEGVLEDLHSMRLAGVAASEEEQLMMCNEHVPMFDIGRSHSWFKCWAFPVCAGCVRCRACGCVCEEP